MPLYICNTAHNAIAEAAKSRIAADITRIHCDITGAPAKFVHTAFFNEEARFPMFEKQACVYGSIRKGRTEEQRAQIAEAIQHSIHTHAGLPQDQIQVMIAETPASWIMEGGDIMPEPGEEKTWLEAHEARRTATEPAQGGQ